jgi:hypothetical protein
MMAEAIAVGLRYEAMAVDVVKNGADALERLRSMRTTWWSWIATFRSYTVTTYAAPCRSCCTGWPTACRFPPAYRPNATGGDRDVAAEAVTGGKWRARARGGRI